MAFVYITQYYTEYKYRPVQEIAEASQTGPATNIIAGIAVGFECTRAARSSSISIAILASYYSDRRRGTAGRAASSARRSRRWACSATAAYILAMDTFGPITDNAGGIVEMSQQPEEIRKKTDRLDAVGNTTKALTKGYAIGSAALAAFLLFSAYLDEVQATTAPTLHVGQPRQARGVRRRAARRHARLPLLARWPSAPSARRPTSSSRTSAASSGRSPGIMQGTEKPDYGRAVDIVTRGALRQMVAPGLLAVGMPIAVGPRLQACLRRRAPRPSPPS